MRAESQASWTLALVQALPTRLRCVFSTPIPRFRESLRNLQGLPGLMKPSLRALGTVSPMGIPIGFHERNDETRNDKTTTKRPDQYNRSNIQLDTQSTKQGHTHLCTRLNEKLGTRRRCSTVSELYLIDLELQQFVLRRYLSARSLVVPYQFFLQHSSDPPNAKPIYVAGVLLYPRDSRRSTFSELRGRPRLFLKRLLPLAMGVTTFRDELRLARLRERLEDRPNNLRATVQAGEPTVTDLTSVNDYSMAATTGSVEWCVRQRLVIHQAQHPYADVHWLSTAVSRATGPSNVRVVDDVHRSVNNMTCQEKRSWVSRKVSMQAMNTTALLLL